MRDLDGYNISMRITDKKFFTQNVEDLAKSLLGKILCVKDECDNIKRAIIVEVECYEGETDSASHCYRGKTERNKIMYYQGGHTYIYLCYGIHWLLNITSGLENQPQGVMIRGICDVLEKSKPMYGPGKVTKHLGLDKSYNSENLTTSNRIWLENNKAIKPPIEIEYFPRVGIDYALPEDREKLWRFRLKDI